MGTSLSHNMIYEGTENLEPRLALWLNLFCSSGIVREGTIVIRCILPPLCLYFWRNKSKSKKKKKERKCWNYWKIWRDLAKSKTYKLEQWVSYNERVKVPKKKIIPATNTTRQKPFILPSAYKEASAFSPRWEHGHITLIPASIIPSKIIVINCNLATKWKQFFKKKNLYSSLAEHSNLPASKRLAECEFPAQVQRSLSSSPPNMPLLLP